MLHTQAIMGLPGGSEWIIILIVALLIFGRRLPEVGKSLGKGIVEFKKGLKGVQDEMDDVEREIESNSDAQDEKPKPPPAQLDSSDDNATTKVEEKPAEPVGERTTHSDP